MTAEELSRKAEEEAQKYVNATQVTTPLLSRFWNTIKNFFVAMFTAVWSGFVDNFKMLTQWAKRIPGLKFWGLETDLMKKSLEYYVKVGMLDKDDLNALISQLDNTPAFGALNYLVASVGLALSYLTVTMRATSGTLTQRLNAQYSPNVPNAESVIGAAFIAPEKTGEVRDLMKRSGLSDHDIDLLFLSAYKTIDENTLRSLYFRGILTEDQVYIRMRELGYTDTRIKELIQGWEVIPGPGDLFTMVAHEAFEPDSIQLLGLADEFPEEQVQWLKKQGLSEYWAKKYWYAHWNEPSIGQGYEMLHRGVIDLKTLELLYRTVEIPPMWRDKLTQIAYMPYTRVDVRRMHEMGVLSDDDLLRAYLDLGYDEEHASKMVEFTIKYNQDNDKQLSKEQIQNGYADNIISRDDALTLLKKLGYTDQQVEFFITYIDYQKAKDIQDDKIDNIKELYLNNFIDDFDCKARLDALNLPAERTAALLEKWQIYRLKDKKLPSKTDLDKFFKAGIIDQDTYVKQMSILGYNNEYISWYLAAMTKK